jgi:hypothetical protein
MTIDVAPAKSPNAMPEFWTWWMEKGPIPRSPHPGELAGDDVLRHLVGHDRGHRDEAEQQPLRRVGREGAFGH